MDSNSQSTFARGETAIKRVLVSDRNAFVRKGWVHVLNATEDFRVTGESPDGRDTYDRILNEVWDVVIMDLDLSDRGGIDLLNEIKRMRPQLPVIIHSNLPEDRYGPRALRGGAAGYLSKSAGLKDALDALRKACSGGKYVSPALAEVLACHLESGSRRAPHDLLSEREYQTLCMLASGKQVTEIAKELSLSVKTVSTFRSRILTKLAMRSNAEITRYALKQGIVD